MIELIMVLINDIPIWWYLPAGLLETIYWLVAILVVYRFNRDLHKSINPHMIDTIYVRSETTDWQGFVKIK